MDSNLTNIKEYYEEVKNLYDIPYEEFEKICRTPFKFVKEKFNEGLLKNIRFQYFGVFEVSKGRVKYSKKQVEKNYREDKISLERYEKRMKVLNNI